MLLTDEKNRAGLPGKIFLIILALILLTAASAMAQGKEEKKLRVKAVKALNAGNYAQAIDIYRDLLKLDPNNPDYNYEIGLAIMENGVNKGEAASFLQVAIAQTKQDTLPDLFLYAGLAEKYISNFGTAIEYFRTYQRLVKREGLAADELKYDVERQIQMCQNASVQFENNKDHVKIKNLGPAINSEYPDYSPVVKKDESLILFTSRRPNSTGGELAQDNKYFEDIYYSINMDGTWSQASNYDSSSIYMNDQVNTPLHDATITYASDETQLLIYRESDVWTSKLENGQWTIPVRAGGRINSAKGFEPSVFITDDEQTMFVVSEIPSGFGGTDIYVTTKKINNNEWNPLQSLGRTINTRYDEDAPFLTKDGNTLYFSSKGHNSLGDYDIFKSVRDEKGNWSEPENLGIPINTPGNDIYFVTSDEGAIGYYASDRPDGMGDMDIYRIILDCKEVSATIVRGRMISEDKNGPVAGSIDIYNPKTGVLINTYMADPLTGRYQMRLKTETEYAFEIKAEGYQNHTGNFTVPKQCEYYTLFQEIKIDHIEDDNGRIIAQRAYVNNAFFDVESKVREDYSAVAGKDNMNEAEMDSLSSIVTTNYLPTELNNYVQVIDVRDVEGNILGNETIGERPVEMSLTQEEVVEKYVARVKEGDNHFEKEYYSESRTDFEIATAIKPDEEYPKQRIKEVNKIIGEKEDAELIAKDPQPDQSRYMREEQLAQTPPSVAAPQAVATEKDEQYNLLIAQANEAFKNDRLSDAEAAYKSALALKADDYPKVQLQAIEKRRATMEQERIASEAKAKALQDETDYNTLVAQGDEALAKNQLTVAKAAYAKAAMMGNESYPKEQLALVDEKMAEEQTMAEYNERVAMGDQAMKDGHMDAAKLNYEQALALKSNEAYPKAQLAAINNEAGKQETQSQYAVLIAKADKALADGDRATAKKSYQEALALKTDESYPKAQLASINEAEDRSQQELYNSLIAEGDKALAKGDNATALSSFKKASNVNKTPYASKQITIVEARMAELAAMSYDELIARGDKAYKAGNDAEALSSYQAAKQKNNSSYPAEQMAAIEARSNQTPLQRYEALIASADQAMANGDQTTALQRYKAAQALTDDAYPTTQIAKIEGGRSQDQEIYDSEMALGEKALKAGNTEEAIDHFQLAQAHSDSKLPGQKIRMIQDGQRLNAQQEARYEQLIASASEAYNAGNLDQAVAAYKEAMPLTKDSYPADQIAAIEAERNAGNSVATRTEPATNGDKNKTSSESQKTPTAGSTIVFRNILFDFDKADLRKASIEELNKVYEYLEKRGEVSLQIDGHTDWIGSVEYNMTLSEKRALAAYNFLVEKGIPEAQMVYQYFGEAVPVAPNANPDGSDNPEGRQLNRRCEFKLDETGTSENMILKF